MDDSSPLSSPSPSPPPSLSPAQPSAMTSPRKNSLVPGPVVRSKQIFAGVFLPPKLGPQPDEHSDGPLPSSTVQRSPRDGRSDTPPAAPIPGPSKRPASRPEPSPDMIEDSSSFERALAHGLRSANSRPPIFSSRSKSKAKTRQTNAQAPSALPPPLHRSISKPTEEQAQLKRPASRNIDLKAKRKRVVSDDDDGDGDSVEHQPKPTTNPPTSRSSIPRSASGLPGPSTPRTPSRLAASAQRRPSGVPIMGAGPPLTPRLGASGESLPPPRLKQIMSLSSSMGPPSLPPSTRALRKDSNMPSALSPEPSKPQNESSHPEPSSPEVQILSQKPPDPAPTPTKPLPRERQISGPSSKPHARPRSSMAQPEPAGAFGTPRGGTGPFRLPRTPRHPLPTPHREVERTESGPLEVQRGGSPPVVDLQPQEGLQTQLSAFQATCRVFQQQLSECTSKCNKLQENQVSSNTSHINQSTQIQQLQNKVAKLEGEILAQQTEIQDLSSQFTDLQRAHQERSLTTDSRLDMLRGETERLHRRFGNLASVHDKLERVCRTTDDLERPTQEQMPKRNNQHAPSISREEMLSLITEEFNNASSSDKIRQIVRDVLSESYLGFRECLNERSTPERSRGGEDGIDFSYSRPSSAHSGGIGPSHHDSPGRKLRRTQRPEREAKRKRSPSSRPLSRSSSKWSEEHSTPTRYPKSPRRDSDPPVGHDKLGSVYDPEAPVHDEPDAVVSRAKRRTSRFSSTSPASPDMMSNAFIPESDIRGRPDHQLQISHPIESLYQNPNPEYRHQSPPLQFPLYQEHRPNSWPSNGQQNKPPLRGGLGGGAGKFRNSGRGASDSSFWKAALSWKRGGKP